MAILSPLEESVSIQSEIVLWREVKSHNNQQAMCGTIYPTVYKEPSVCYRLLVIVSTDSLQTLVNNSCLVEFITAKSEVNRTETDIQAKEAKFYVLGKINADAGIIMHQSITNSEGYWSISFSNFASLAFFALQWPK